MEPMTAPTTSRNERHEFSVDTELIDLNCLSVVLAAKRASRRWAIREHFFARAARRQSRNRGASTTLGDACNAYATEATYADATLPTDADATERFTTLRNATERGLTRRTGNSTRGGIGDAATQPTLSATLAEGRRGAEHEAPITEP
jgi:hypothetical protein